MFLKLQLCYSKKNSSIKHKDTKSDGFFLGQSQSTCKPDGLSGII